MIYPTVGNNSSGNWLSLHVGCKSKSNTASSFVHFMVQRINWKNRRKRKQQQINVISEVALSVDGVSLNAVKQKHFLGHGWSISTCSNETHDDNRHFLFVVCFQE